MQKGKIYLIPCTLGEYNTNRTIPDFNREVTENIRHFIVENDKTARRFLRAWMADFPLQACEWNLLNKHTDPADLSAYLAPILQGKDVGVLSEAGCPAVADPGNVIVAMAHEKGIEVIPLVGPSSILLALMGSGFNGQQFTFHGYLPKQRPDRVRRIRELDKIVRTTGYSQIFMDTPFRNMNVLEDLLEALPPDALLSIGTDLTLTNERISTKPISYWRKHQPKLHKRPCIFVLGR